jgi:Na+/phosphate symporter
MSSNEMAVMLLYGGPPLLIMLMLAYGVSLVQTKPNQTPPTLGTKMFGWSLILLSLAIVILAIASMMKKNK